jgi:hypothetical protein
MIRRFISAQIVVAVLVALGGVASPAGASEAVARDTATAGFTYTGDAYGTYAFVDDTVTLGKSAAVALGSCSTQVGVHKANTVAFVNGDPLVSTGAIDTTADTLSISGGSEATTSATVHEASALAGLITASELTAVSTTSHTASGFQVSAAGTSAVDLVVAGIPIIGTPAPNTRINLLGFGYVVLNEQIAHVGPTSASLTVNMLHVHITVANPLGIAVGTNIIVAHAKSGMSSFTSSGTLDGFAFGTRADLAGVVLSGETARVTVPCLGTNGQTITNSVASVNAPPFFTTGAVTDTASGTVGSTSVAHTTSTIAAVNLVSGTATADVITADVQASITGSTITFSDNSSFVNLVVFGHPELSGNPPPNTKVMLAGLGTLWLHRVIQRSNSIEVRMIELIVTESNPFGILVGTDIRVGDAEASVHSV